MYMYIYKNGYIYIHTHVHTQMNGLYVNTCHLHVISLHADTCVCVYAFCHLTLLDPKCSSSHQSSVLRPAFWLLGGPGMKHFAQSLRLWGQTVLTVIVKGATTMG